MQELAQAHGITTTPAHVVTANHVTLVYRPTDAQASALHPWMGKTVDVNITSIRVGVAPEGGDIVACGVELGPDAPSELCGWMPPHAHITVQYTPPFRAVDSTRLFQEDKTHSLEVRVFPDVTTVHGVITAWL